MILQPILHTSTEEACEDRLAANKKWHEQEYKKENIKNVTIKM